MGTNIGPKIGIDGESEYRRTINNLIQQSKTLASEMKAVTASFDSNTTAQERAAAQSTVLERQIEVQTKRVAELAKMVAAASASYDENDNKLLEWKQALNNAKASLYSMEQQLDDVTASMENVNTTELTFDESAYKQALANLEQQAKTLASEMRVVTAEFDDSATAQDRVATQTAMLSKQIDVQKQRVSTLKEALEKASTEYGENDSRTLRWRQSLNEATVDLRQMEKELKDLPKSIDDVSDAMDDAGDSTFKFGDALKAGTIIEGGKAIVGALMDIVENTEEYRKIMASLEVSSERAGYTADQTAESYRLLYGVLGDDQSSATALANLQALKLNQDDLNVLITGTIGAWAAYGDSIPIDSLAEAINETVKVGEVTGTFADVLNWAGASEDEFNRKLAEATDEAARMDIVMQELARQGLVEVGEAWQVNNESLVEANNATNDLNGALARFAEMASPAVNTVKQEIADLANSAMDLLEGNSQIEAEITQTVDSLVVDLNRIYTEGLTILNENIESTRAGFEAAFDSIEVGVAADAEAITNLFTVTISDGLAALDEAVQSTKADFSAAWDTIEAGVAAEAASLTNFFTVTIPDGLATLDEIMQSTKDDFIAAWKSADAAVAANAESVSSSTSDMAGEVRSSLTALSGEASGWGSDMVSEFAGGISSNQSIAARAASAVASAVRRLLHFTVPDEGPLSDADEYGPDFMKLLSKGMTDNIDLVSAAAEKAAAAMVIQPQMTAVGATSNTVNRYGGFTINVYGTEGQSVSELADAVMDRMQMLVMQEEVSFGG